MTASEDSAKDFGDDGSGTGGASSGGSAGSAGTGGGLPPEEEHEESYTVPAVSGQWIWTANPESGRVAVIDAVSARVSTANAGLAPTYLAALGGASENESGAIVINVGSRDVSVFRATNGAVTSADKVPLGAPANRLSVSPSSRWAIAWSDASLLPSVDPTEGMQDVTVIDLGESPPKAERLSVGYRPSRVFIAADESHAFVVSEPSVSVIELGGEATASVLRDVEITSNPTEAPSARDVTVTPDGALFFVRRNDASYVEVVALDDGRRVSVNLTGVVTDLDLSPDGSSAFAVVRGLPPTPAASGSAGGSEGPGGTAEGGMGGEPGAAGGGGDGGTGGTAVESTLAVLPVDTVLGAPGDYRAIGIPGVVGSIAVSPSGDTALLYTNATASDRVVILDTSGARPRTRTVVVEAPVRAVIPARDGAHAVVLLGQAPGSTKPGGFALVPVKETFPPRIVGTDAPPASVAVGESHALVTIAGKDLPSGVYFARFPELHPEFIRLASTPLSTALMPDVGRGFVAQSHPEGRITFIDLVTGAPRTITGFELGAKVVTDD
ncbi:MAG TPA: hypothetical protein VFZ53_27820 [Polyangiaceae bacterium]